MTARIALLSHRGGNIGHEFMALGMEVVVRRALGEDVELEHFEQHRPFGIYPEGHPLRLLDRVRHGRLQAVKHLINTETISRWLWRGARELRVRLAINCGGPNIVARVARSADMGLMFHHLPGAFHAAGVPVIDAAVGACFPWERVPERIESPADVAFYRRLFAYFQVSTVRDRLAERLWRDLGHPVVLIPCVALASGVKLETHAPSDDGAYVLVNFLEKGANEDWGQKVDVARWETVVRELLRRLRARHRVAFICHNANEARLAGRLAEREPIFQPTDLVDYARVAAGAKAALVNRIHAAIPLAGLGVPSFTVGTDTRMGAVELIGLPTLYVKQATAERLEAEIESLIGRRRAERERLLALREAVITRYGEVIRNTMEK